MTRTPRGILGTLDVDSPRVKKQVALELILAEQDAAADQVARSSTAG